MKTKEIEESAQCRWSGECENKVEENLVRVGEDEKKEPKGGRHVRTDCAGTLETCCSPS